MKKLLPLLFLFSFPSFLYSQNLVNTYVLTEDGWNNQDSIQMFGRLSAVTVAVDLLIENDIDSYDKFEGMIVMINNFLPCNAEYQFYRKEYYANQEEFTWIDITDCYKFEFIMLVNKTGFSRYVVIAKYK